MPYIRSDKPARVPCFLNRSARQFGRLAGAVAAVLISVGITTATARDFKCTDVRQKKTTYRIVGGHGADPSNWPFIVGLKMKARPANPFCGGSLINKKWVLTAAHCTQPNLGRESEFMVQRVGSNGEASGEAAGYRRVFVHPEYRRDNAGNLYNDVALIRLDRPLNIPNSKLVLLPKPSTEVRVAPSGSCAAIAGWGTTAESGSQPTRLQEVFVPTLSQSQCRSGYGSVISNTPHLCAGYLPGGKDSCQGDSGGPLIVRAGPTGFLQVGVVSYGQGCARRNKPGVYARVSTYRNWIFQTISQSE